VSRPAAASPAEEDATLPHQSLWTPAAGIPLGPRAVADTGVRPLVVPPVAEPRHRFPTLLAVGNLVALKRHRLMVEALVSLPEADLVIVGEGPERGSIEALARKRRIAAFRL